MKYKITFRIFKHNCSYNRLKWLGCGKSDSYIRTPKDWLPCTERNCPVLKKLEVIG